MSKRKRDKLPIRDRAGKYVVDFRKLPPQFWPEECAKSGQKLYPTRAQAEGAAAAACQDHDTAMLTGMELTPQRRQLAMEAFRKLEDLPDKAIVEAVDLYRKERTDTALELRTFQQVVDAFLASRASVVAANTLQDSYKPKYKKLAETFGARNFPSIKTAELEQWLDANTTKEGREGWCTHMVMLWNFAVQRNFAVKNVAAAVPRLSRQQRKKLRSRPPAILDAGELQNLLDAALAYRGGWLLPYFAICALAGIRPEEVKKLSWDNILWNDGQIHVPAEASKTGDDREVPMVPALIEWLQEIPAFRRQGPFAWTRETFDLIRENAGLSERWREPKGRDILRHSAASHDYRLNGNIEATAGKMGHDVMTFRHHYKARIRTKQEAEAYFNVRPKTATDKTLRIVKAG